jgi:hypothetical protein
LIGIILVSSMILFYLNLKKINYYNKFMKRITMIIYVMNVWTAIYISYLKISLNSYTDKGESGFYLWIVGCPLITLIIILRV